MKNLGFTNEFLKNVPQIPPMFANIQSNSMENPPIKGYFCKIPSMKPCGNFKIEINNNN